jgi:hypothetical protein
MTKNVEGESVDDFEAARQIIAILTPFQDADRERIFRWAREKLNMPLAPREDSLGGMADGDGGFGGGMPGALSADATPASKPPADIKSFIESKDPKNGTQFAAATAYYYRFLAPEKERKDTIGSEDLLDAYRKAERGRPARPLQTLVDAYGDGVFDKAERGSYRLNNVGENLVAMVLPGKATEARRSQRGRGRKRSGAKKGAKKRAGRTAGKAAKSSRK